MTLLRRALPPLLLAVLAAGSARAAAPLERVAALDSRYDVRVVALVEATRVTKKNPDPELNGTRKATVRWTGTWTNARVRVQNASAALVISGNSTGSIRGAFTFADSRPGMRCRGAQTISSPARLVVAATRPASGPTSLDLAAFATKPISPSFCPADDGKLPLEAPSAIVEGLAVRVSNTDQGVRVARVDRTRALFVPVEQLRDGVSFSISNSLTRSSKKCGYKFCTKTVRAEVRLTFKPRR